MKPIEVVGWEKKTGRSGKVGLWIYGQREIAQTEGQLEGEGYEAIRLYINPEYCDYVPQIGHKIIPVEGRFGIDEVYVVN